MPFTGCGAEVARVLELSPMGVYDLHNHGCVSFISMIGLAQSLLTTSWRSASADLQCPDSSWARVCGRGSS